MFKFRFLPSRRRHLARAINTSRAVIEFDRKGKIRRANRNFLELMGYAACEIVGQHHSMFVLPDDVRSPDYAAFWKGLGDGTIKSGEFRRVSKDGREVWIYGSYAPITNLFGRVTGVIKFAADITSAKLATAHAESQINAISRSMAVIEFDLDGTIRRANDNFLSALGYDADEIAGRHHAIFVDPDEARSPAYAAFWDKLGKGHFASGEFRRFGKDGSEIWIQASYNPLLDASGKPIGVIKFATDITAMVKARRKHEQLALVSERTDTSSIICDAQGRIEYVNAGFTRSTGYEFDEVLGRKPGDFLQGPGTDPETVKRIGMALRDGAPFFDEILNYTKQGTPYWTSLAVNPVKGSDGKIERYISVQTIITETKMRSLEFTTKLEAIGSVNVIAEWNGTGEFAEANARLDELGGHEGAAVSLDTLLDGSLVERLRHGEVVRCELPWPSSREQALWFDAVFSAVIDMNGKVEKFLMFGSDISARRAVVETSISSLNGVIDAAVEIDTIVGSLSQIARQTDLLAINASIEAALAGKAGAGFAIVADRVRSLADKSTSEAGRITALAQESRELVSELSAQLSLLSDTQKGSEDRPAAPLIDDLKNAA
ncbi:methyl-accepting chemotaxis sensory transducer with Pas/Pac sensor [Palleronia aestuarii]|uniref:Methyl-accepting chemotaxis sensory transducer with Pas/Pac sensor n=1 Tax=Palleronia aestuarii TaxID=568105 RepID=A0A2W7PSD2_9RHOB|nr:PAS domain S-box protein [Palleronia aestuarii]PZX12349.1 methyl-accepting chemotaxis sensory transducer with Pas/Pac sensor [Palleronia aestuarii]